MLVLRTIELLQLNLLPWRPSVLECLLIIPPHPAQNTRTGTVGKHDPGSFSERVRVTGDTEHAISRSVNGTPNRVVSNGSSAMSRVGIDEQIPVLGVRSH